MYPTDSEGEAIRATEGFIEVERDSDADDVRAAAAGDTAAFGRLYHRHVGRVKRTAEWVLGTDVSDPVQDAFLRAWQKLPLYRGEASFGTWLGRLSTHVFLRERERRARDRGRSVDLEAHRAGTAPAQSPGIRVDIDRAVESLPERARLVFVLFDVQGFSHDEIAAQLGISAPTSRSQLHRARTILRAFLEEETG